jgi:SAM-dependent methyltransferase
MFPLDARSVLDVGCGSGQQLAEFLQWGRGCSLHGIDLVEDRILAARARLASADLCVGDACRLPWPNATFDVVTQFTVFTSVRDKDMKRQIASEMLRVSKPDGLILWCDFRYNNPRNSNVRGIEAKEIRSLFPGCVVKLEKIGLAPPLARAVVPVSWIAALMLEKAPFLRTQYLGTIRRTAPLGRTYDEGERRPQFGTPRPNDLSSLPPTLD